MKYMLRKPLHSSWMIALISSAIFIGVVIAKYVHINVGLPWALVGVLLAVIAITRQRIGFVIAALVAGVLIGFWRGSLELGQQADFNYLRGKNTQLTGTVTDDSDTDKRGNVVIRLKDTSIGEHRLAGTIWVSLAAKSAPIERSDIVTIRGVVQKGFGAYQASLYRAEIATISRPEPGDIALHVRDWFASAVRRVIPEPESSLGVGYLVGQRRNLPNDLDESLKIAGLTHVVVASGYNLTILVRLARRLFEKISKYLAAVVSGGLILGFIAITGASPSMSRAGLVSGLALLAWYYGRKFHPIVILSLAIGLTVLINPNYAWGDIGWQLSFASFAGVMVLAPLLQRYYFGEKPPGVVRQVVGETMSAWLCTLPILLLTFGYISNVAVIANALILPLVPLAMLLVFIAGIGSLAVPVIGTLIALPATLLLTYMVQTTEFMAHLSWAKSDISITPWHVALFYGLLIIFTWYMWYKTKFNLRHASIVD